MIDQISIETLKLAWQKIRYPEPADKVPCYDCKKELLITHLLVVANQFRCHGCTVEWYLKMYEKSD